MDSGKFTRSIRSATARRATSPRATTKSELRLIHRASASEPAPGITSPRRKSRRRQRWARRLRNPRSARACHRNPASLAASISVSQATCRDGSCCRMVRISSSLTCRRMPSVVSSRVSPTCAGKSPRSGKVVSSVPRARVMMFWAEDCFASSSVLARPL